MARRIVIGSALAAVVAWHLMLPPTLGGAIALFIVGAALVLLLALDVWP